jgi:hypothetical protein
MGWFSVRIMGSQGSKLEQHPQQVNESKESVVTESVPSSPILTPLDPRSPSVNIARTPLEVSQINKVHRS